MSAIQTRTALLHAALHALDDARFADAAQACRPLLRARRRDVEAELLLGLALGGQGDIEPAADLLDGVARARPDHAHPCQDLAGLLLRLGRPAQAAMQYEAALRRDPDNAQLRRAAAAQLLSAGNPDAAMETLAPLLDAMPDDAATQHLAGLACAELGRIDAAIGHFQRTVARDPGPADGWSNLGMMLKITGRFDEALAAHDAAVARAPDAPQIRVNRAVALLHAGRLAEAWRDYEWRLRLPGHASLPLETLLPSLAEPPELAGRHVLVTHEEGFGDTLHFLRYVPMLAARGARVTLAVPAELARLAAQVAPVLAPDAPLPAFDFHCPFFSLPRAFATTMATIPAPIPYLRADPARTAAWAARLPRDGLRVGLVWAGQARPWLPGFATLDRRRSLRLADLAPLAAVPGARFISLQKGEPAAEATAPPPGLALFDPMAEVTDFAETAAIIANLDLVVSVDTAVVHLAGAMGKPVFLLDRYDNCWRWFNGRTDSPWYPTVRIFRQDRMGAWEAPIRRVVQAVREAATAAPQPCNALPSVP